MDENALPYRAYLLRIWRADNGGRPVWRFSLQPTRGGPARVFGDTGALIAFLEGGHDRPAAAAESARSDDR